MLDEFVLFIKLRDMIFCCRSAGLPQCSSEFMDPFCHISIEGAPLLRGYVFDDAITLWKNGAKTSRHIFSESKRVNGVMMENWFCSHIIFELDGHIFFTVCWCFWANMFKFNGLVHAFMAGFISWKLSELRYIMAHWYAGAFEQTWLKVQLMLLFSLLRLIVNEQRQAFMAIFEWA